MQWPMHRQFMHQTMHRQAIHADRPGVQTIPLARDQSGQLSVPSTPFTPLHKTMTDLNLMMLAHNAKVMGPGPGSSSRSESMSEQQCGG